MTAEAHVSRHPLLLHRLALLRDRSTRPPLFRRFVREMTQMLFFEAAADLALEGVTVATPLTDCRGQRLSEAVGLFPILRAGLGMAEAVLEVLPEAQVWHLGLYRDHTTHQPVTYYNKLPERPQLDLGIVLDPMLATGGSAVVAIDILKGWGVGRLKFVGLIAAPEGVAAVRSAHPDVPLYLAALDSHLNADKYIVPGLGDAGDRQFATH
jgi:uracil phosphoribosyltransferase